jgi:hypothetical protein
MCFPIHPIPLLSTSYQTFLLYAKCASESINRPATFCPFIGLMSSARSFCGSFFSTAPQKTFISNSDLCFSEVNPMQFFNGFPECSFVGRFCLLLCRWRTGVLKRPASPDHKFHPNPGSLPMNAEKENLSLGIYTIDLSNGRSISYIPFANIFVFLDKKITDWGAKAKVYTRQSIWRNLSGA